VLLAFDKHVNTGDIVWAAKPYFNKPENLITNLTAVRTLTKCDFSTHFGTPVY